MKKMIKSKKYNKWILIDIVAILIIIAISLIYTLLSNTVEKELNYTSSTNDTLFNLIVLIICSIPSILSLLAIYFGIRLTIKKVEKNNLTYNATEDILYYREILGDLTPFEISILANLNIEDEKDVAATILWYQNKQYLDIKDGQINIADNLNLTEKDKCFLKFLKTKDLGYLEAYKNYTYKDLQTKKYIVENEYYKHPLKIILKNAALILGLFFLSAVIVILNIFFVKDLVLQKILDVVLIVGNLLMTYKKVSSFMLGYASKMCKYRRTKLCEEKTNYIHALQNFIHDFSNLKNYDKDQIVLWEDFLVYAIILEQNDIIIEEINQLFHCDYSTYTSLFYKYIKNEK